ncbi:MAG: DUF1189 family protein, partial [Acholeplasmataceae bacterium]|nr:DUF1189 family protein [Acholeplasmataceae bacterium]
ALKNTIVLDDDEIFYFNQKGDYITGDYKHVEKALYFYELKNMDRGEAASEFFDLIDSAFNKYAVFYSVISYTLIQYAMNSFLVIVLALIMLLIKIKFEKVTTFSENIKIVIVSMTIPSIIAFIASLLNFRALNPFFAVIFQFLTPIIAILSLYKGRITKEKSPKGL